MWPNSTKKSVTTLKKKKKIVNKLLWTSFRIGFDHPPPLPPLWKIHKLKKVKHTRCQEVTCRQLKSEKCLINPTHFFDRFNKTTRIAMKSFRLLCFFRYRRYCRTPDFLIPASLANGWRNLEGTIFAHLFCWLLALLGWH